MFTWAAVWAFLKKVPAWAWWLLGAVIVFIAGGEMLKREKKKAFEQGEEEAETKAAVERERQISHQTQETLERVEDFHEARSAVIDLAPDELRDATKTDPNNRGRVQRD